MDVALARFGQPHTLRRAAVSGLAVAVLVASGAAMITDTTELWPFCNYTMFAHVRTRGDRPVRVRRLYGVVEGDTERELALDDLKYLRPLTPEHVDAFFARPPPSGQPGAGDAQRLLEQELADCYVRYEHLRGMGAHDGPPLRGMRLYALQWDRDPSLRNFEHPSRKTLLGAWERP